MEFRPRLPRTDSFRSELHDERTAAFLGVALGCTFMICFATGLVSHLIQNPPTWFAWPAAPRDAYRIITATHVVTGFASVPLLLAKLWTVYPKFWRRPFSDGPAHTLERLSVVPLVGGSLFLFVGGIDDAMYIYVNPFTFTPTHYVASWITVGALVIHVGAKRSITVRALRRRSDPTPQTPPAARSVFSGER